MEKKYSFKNLLHSDPRIQVDVALKNLIAPLTKSEYEYLTSSILAEGCRDSIMCFVHPEIGDLFTVFDGHNRLEICKKHEIRLNVDVYQFENIDEVKNWMIENQLSRRNLTDAQRDYYLGKLYSKAKAQHGGDRKSKVQNELLKTSEEVLQSAEKSAVEKLAEKENVSISTLKRNEEFANSLDAITVEAPQVKAKILKSNIPKKTIVELAKSENLPIIQQEIKTGDAKWTEFVKGLDKFKNHKKKEEFENEVLNKPEIPFKNIEKGASSKIESLEDLQKSDNQATKEILVNESIDLNAKITELEERLAKKEMLKNGNIKFTAEDFKNKELQAEYFGLYSEMPVATQKTYISIPKNQYYFFRGFIESVCLNRKKELEEMSQLREENEKLNRNKQSTDNQYYIETSTYASSNKLQEAVHDFIRQFNGILISDIKDFQDMLSNKINELNAKFPRCTPLEVSYNDFSIYHPDDKHIGNINIRNDKGGFVIFSVKKTKSYKLNN